MTKPLRFIVADDSPDDRFFLTRALSRSYPQSQVFCFSDGDQALEYYKRCGADAIVTDFRMPRMPGTELIRSLRTCAPEIPVVLVSDFPDCREQALAAGANDVLNKCELKKLPEVLNTLLARPANGFHRDFAS